jgi:hypothetical protein
MPANLPKDEKIIFQIKTIMNLASISQPTVQGNWKPIYMKGMN